MPPTAAMAACVQSWGAFKRALELDPAHGLSLQNRRDLTGFLSHTSEGQRIMHANLWHKLGQSGPCQAGLTLWPAGTPEAPLIAPLSAGASHCSSQRQLERQAAASFPALASGPLGPRWPASHIELASH